MISAVLFGVLTSFLIYKTLTSESDNGMLGWGFLTVVSAVVAVIVLV